MGDQDNPEAYRLGSEAHRQPSTGTCLQEEVVIGRAGRRDLRGILFRPRAPSAPRPAVVFLHAGGWAVGSVHHFDRQAAAMTAHGFVGLSVDYRLSGEQGFPAAIEDSKCGVRFLRARARELGVDAARIGAVGGSAGAHLAALLATAAGRADWEGAGGHAGHSSAIQAAVLLNGEFDLPSWWRTASSHQYMIPFLGDRCEAMPGRYRDASPITHASARTPPCLLIHGEADEDVPIQQSVDFHQRLRASGAAAELIRVPEVGHAWFDQEPHFTPCLRAMAGFLRARLATLQR